MICFSTDRKFPKWFTVVTTISFFIFSVAGCSAHQQVSQPSTQIPPVPNYKFFSHPASKVINAIEKTLYNQGYVITLRDDNGGIINAEHYTTSPLQEDQEQIQEQGPSAGEVILTILGIVLIIGLIVMIVDASSSNSNTSSKEKDEHYDNDRNEHYEHHDDNKIIGYKYVMNFRTTAMTDTSSKVELNMTKVIVENGTPTSSAAVKSSAILKIFFESLENELYFVQ